VADRDGKYFAQTTRTVRSLAFRKVQGENPMNKGALALLVRGGSRNCLPRWKRRFDIVARTASFCCCRRRVFDPTEVH